MYRVRVRVSSRVRDSVSFIFYCIFSFPMYVKRPKITTRSSASLWLSGTVFILCLLSHGFESYSRYYFFTFFKSSFSKFSVNQR